MNILYNTVIAQKFQLIKKCIPPHHTGHL